jgi:hypothetical protein
VCLPWQLFPRRAPSNHRREGTMRYHARRDRTRARTARLIGSGRSGQARTTCRRSGSVTASASLFAARSSRSAGFPKIAKRVRIPPSPLVIPVEAQRHWQARHINPSITWGCVVSWPVDPDLTEARCGDLSTNHNKKLTLFGLPSLPPHAVIGQPCLSGSVSSQSRRGVIYGDSSCVGTAEAASPSMSIKGETTARCQLL